MENHPIPQDVTGFQFRLIGDMTVKQFAYLAGAAVIGWLFFVLPIPLPGIIKFPFSISMFGAGAALAFLPISGRPMDLMVGNFIKALFTPSQYLYRKTGGSFLFEAINFHPAKAEPKNAQKQPVGASASKASEENLSAFLKTVSPKPKSALDEKEDAFLQKVTQGFGNQPASTPTPFQPQQQAPKQEEQAKPQAPATAPMDAKLQAALMQKQRLEEELGRLESELSRPVSVTTFQTGIQTPQPVLVKTIPKPQRSPFTKSAVPLTPEFPNVVTGVVRDSRGNILPNILVEIKDNEGNPIRAFKTNDFGQFASATPLPNGVFTIELEDPKNVQRFDLIELSINGTILPPLEITSTDAREELRRALFTGAN